MIYQNEKARIRPFERADISERYRSWFHDPDATRHNSHGLFPYTPAAMEAFIRTIEQGDQSKIVWAIESVEIEKRGHWEREGHEGKQYFIVDNVGYCSKTEAIHIGNVSLQSINLLNRSAELAIVIGDGSQRFKGIGTQVCKWALDHAFLKLGLNRVWTGTSVTNIGMQKVCDKIGMAQEGRFKQGMFLHGKFVDVLAYGITADEWFAERNAQ